MSQKITGETKIETGKTNGIHSKDHMHIVNNADEGMIHTRPLIPDVSFHPGPTYRPLPNLLDHTCQRVMKVHRVCMSVENINPDINLDFEENSPFQEAIISKLSKDQSNHYFRNQKN